MLAYCQEVQKLEGTFDELELTHVFRNDNNEADELAKMGSKRTQIPAGVFVQQLHQPTISEEPTKPVDKPTEAEIFVINPSGPLRTSTTCSVTNFLKIGLRSSASLGIAGGML